MDIGKPLIHKLVLNNKTTPSTPSNTTINVYSKYQHYTTSICLHKYVDINNVIKSHFTRK